MSDPNPNKYKLAVVGSRAFNNYALMCSVLDPVKANISMVVSGGAVGADSLGAQWARENKITLLEIRPDWDQYGKGAGFRRNIEIVKAVDKVLVFWDGKSKGTAHTVDQAIRLAKPYHVIVDNPAS